MKKKQVVIIIKRHFKNISRDCEKATAIAKAFGLTHTFTWGRVCYGPHSTESHYIKKAAKIPFTYRTRLIFWRCKPGKGWPLISRLICTSTNSLTELAEICGKITGASEKDVQKKLKQIL